jgi:hypothetical protein
MLAVSSPFGSGVLVLAIVKDASHLLAGPVCPGRS